MKKNSVFWHIAALFALSLTFLFSSCADFTSSSSGTGSVSFSLSPSVFRSALENLDLEELSNYSFRLDVFVKGDYEAKQTKTWSDLVAAIESNADSITEEMEYSEILTLIAQKLSDGSTFSFGNIPIGKKVRVEGKFYQIVSYSEREAPEAPIEELLFHGSSAEKTIESGANAIGLSIFKAYAEFPLEITLNFPAGTETEVSSFVYSLSLVMAVSDSDKVKDLSALLASGDKFAIYTAIKAFQFSSSLYDYPSISYVPGNYEITGTSVKITDTVSLPVSITDKNSGEELAIIPIINDSTLAGKYCVSGSIPKITPVKGQTTSTSFDVQKLGIIDTDMMLYNVQYDEDNSVDGYKYYLTDNAGQTITSDTQATVTTSSSANSFCFDGDGYYYVIAGKEEDATYIKSNKPDFGSETLGNTIVPDSMHLYGDLGGLLTVDRLTNKLYMFDGSNSEISQITKDDGEYAYDGTNYIPAKTFSFSEDSNCEKINWESVFTVYNGVVYFASVSEGVNLVIADLENATAGESEGYYNITGSKLVSLELGEMDLSSDAKITDMLYQDGAVYILLNDSRTSNDESEVYSRGAVIKYDTSSGNIKTVGWTEGKVTNDVKTGAKVSQYGYQLYESYGVESDFDTGVPYVYDFGSNGGGRDYSFYAPYDNIDSVFAGPQKFIAIKPKKLVIADSGVAFYTDSDGVLKYKDVSRVVYVDLEKLSITDAADVSDVDFCSSYPVPGSTNIYSSATDFDITSLYRWTTSGGGEFIALSTSSSVQLYANFIKGE